MWLIACFHRIDGHGGRFIISFEDFSKIIRHAAEMQRKGFVDIVTVSEGAKRLKQ